MIFLLPAISRLHFTSSAAVSVKARLRWTHHPEATVAYHWIFLLSLEVSILIATPERSRPYPACLFWSR